LRVKFGIDRLIEEDLVIVIEEDLVIVIAIEDPDLVIVIETFLTSTIYLPVRRKDHLILQTTIMRNYNLLFPIQPLL